MQSIHSPKQQRGATMLGMLVIVAILGLALYSIMRLWPVYFEYYSIARSMDAVAKENEGGDIPALRKGLERHWEIEDIKSITVKDIEIKKTSSGYEMHAEYEGRAPFVANVFWVVEFDKTVTAGSGASRD
jgi:hypothetical protein